MNYRMKVVVLGLLIIIHFSVAQGQGASWSEELEPVGATQYRVMEVDNRRRLSPFQLCLLCKCCAAASSSTSNATCVTIPCCFGIDCQLPNKPYGVCAFVPKTCSCTSCAHH